MKTPEVNSQGLVRGWMGANLIASTAFLPIAIILFFAITAFFHLTIDNWQKLLVIRVGVLVVAVAWFLATTSHYIASFLKPKDKKFYGRTGLVVGIYLGLLLSFSPLIDLIQGPQKIHGVVTDVNIYEEIDINARDLWITVTLQDTEGRVYRFRSYGQQAVRWRDFLKQAKQNATIINVTALKRSGCLLSFDTKEY